MAKKTNILEKKTKEQTSNKQAQRNGTQMK
jgi:hypothetical protein